MPENSYELFAKQSLLALRDRRGIESPPGPDVRAVTLSPTVALFDFDRFERAACIPHNGAA